VIGKGAGVLCDFSAPRRLLATAAGLHQAFMLHPLHSARGSSALSLFDQLRHAPANFVVLYAGEAQLIGTDLVQCFVGLRSIGVNAKVFGEGESLMGAAYKSLGNAPR